MDTYIALFRGINVGGKNILPMKNLVEILEGIGCKKVRTYIQSGNSIFQAGKTQTKKLAKEIGEKIAERHAFKPEIVILELSELEEAIKNNPFRTEDGKALHFFFLGATPEKPDLAGLLNVKTNSEEFKLGKNIFYLYAPDGIGRSKLASKVEAALGVPATARNLNTVNCLMAMVKQV